MSGGNGVCVCVENNATGGTTGLYTAQRMNGLRVVVDYFSRLCVCGCASADRIAGGFGIWNQGVRNGPPKSDLENGQLARHLGSGM